jgi:Flp pilus assembly protein CpaB
VRDESPRRVDRPPLARPSYRPLTWRARARLAERRLVRYWLVTLLLAGAAGTTVARSLDEAARRIDELGPTALVAVATRPLPAGAVVQADDVEWRSLPVGGVSPAAVTADDPPVGRTVHERIEAHEPIVRSRLAPAPLQGIAAKTPAGHRALAVELDDRAPPLVEGQLVDVYTGGQRELAPRPADLEEGRTAPAGFAVARSALVVQVDEHRATLAVREDDAASVAAALIEGTVVLAVVGPSSSG